MKTIEELKQLYEYNKEEGMHTLHFCKCGNNYCRKYKCNKCIEKEIEQLKRK